VTGEANRTTPALVARDLHKVFRRETGEEVQALDRVSITVDHGELTALVGPDGAGKTTLIRLAAGLMLADGGEIDVLGINAAVDPQQIQSRIAYMPQRFGLYEDLTVQQNLDLYANLHGVTREQRQKQYPRLMEMTALGRFTDRLAGRLSGGMKQKLGLACTLVRQPELLLLDEPTVGVDPLSRRELWEIIHQLLSEGLTVMMSTSYLDEAERCDHVAVMVGGKVLAHGEPAEVSRLAAGHTFLAKPPEGQKAREFQSKLLEEPEVIDAVPEGGRVRIVRQRGKAGGGEPTTERFEDGFMILLRGEERRTDGGQGDKVTRRQGDTRAGGSDVTLSPGHLATLSSSSESSSRDQTTVVEVHDLIRRFGDFTAVDHVTFEVHRGEIFGLLGPNGAGKTTTFRMLCGLLPASGGTLNVAGVDVRHARASARQRIGYVAQKFSLYGQLSVTDNLEFFASAYSLRGGRKRERIAWAMDQFGLKSMARLPAGQLPGGFKQRLAMAAALLHEPEILFLDEPTSGADPLARRDFWRRITALAQHGVTVIITTHFMEEAEYCDRAVILDSGKVLAQGTPAEIRSHAQRRPDGREPNMEDAFIGIVEEARNPGDAKNRAPSAAK
jgi:ABC-2 type transport system ATP-binding protein